MNGWTKFFTDGSIEIGTDQDVKDKKSSWSKGRLTNMSGCQINHDDATISLVGNGEFWQSDDFEVNFLESIPTCVTRRLQKKIDSTDKSIIVYKATNSKKLKVIFKDTLEPFAIDLSSKTGQWLIVELLLDKPGIKLFLKEEKI